MNNSSQKFNIIEDYQDGKNDDNNGKGPQNQPSFLKNMLEGAIFLETKAAWQQFLKMFTPNDKRLCENGLPKASDEFDVFRDSPFRYVCYANELGESFHTLFPWLLGPSYLIAFSYVTADTIDKFVKHYKKDDHEINRGLYVKGVDTLMWHSFASITMPGLIIHNLVHLLDLKLATSSIYAVSHFGPTAIALLTIPLIVNPIDEGVDFAFDNTLRKT